MDTNIQMLKNLDVYFMPKESGFVSIQEINLIKSTLCLGEMDELQLRNLRDMAVIYFDMRKDNVGRASDYWDVIVDKASAIIHMIDLAINK